MMNTSHEAQFANDAEFVEQITFDDRGLAPAVVQDAETNQVLMLAWVNAEALLATLNEGRTVFWSRSRQELWRKGETSGNTQDVVSVAHDCDADTVLIRVVQHGPACHTGTETCFTGRSREENVST
jgi:phosphoribosyl-AMP cyclohydrolase